MACKCNRNNSLSILVPFIAILTLLIADAVLAPVKSAGQTSRRPIVGAMDSIPPSFVPAVSYDSGGYVASAIAVGDLKGDGKLDLVVADKGSGTICVMLGNGDGTFQEPVPYSAGGASQLLLVDVNGDGKLDIVMASGSVGVMLGNGDGTFKPLVGYGAGNGGAFAIALADVNGDGILDVVTANTCADESCDGSVGVLLGNGDGTFRPAVSYSSGGMYAKSVAVADLNGDGKPDLVVTNMDIPGSAPNGSVGVLLGNGDGTFKNVVVYPSGGYWADSVAALDVNGDGKPDVMVANTGSFNVGVLLGNGDGTLQAVSTFYSGGGDSMGDELAVADVNGDGKADLLVTTPCGGLNCGNPGMVGVLLGNGDGTFQTLVSFVSGGYGAASLAVGDVNGDGKPDLVVANTCSSWQTCGDSSGAPYGTVGVLLNNTGAPTTTTALISSLNPLPLGKVVTYTASVTAKNGEALTGSVTFQDKGSTIATVPLANNQAAYSTKYKIGGAQPMTATYTGDLHDAASTSAILMEYVEGAGSTTVVTTSESPSLVGQPVMFSATVTSHHGKIPNGELVTFYDNGAAIGAGTTSGGVATFTTSSLTVKKHSVKASYPGDDTFEPSSGLVEQIVDKYSTSTTLSSGLNPSNFGQAVTFKATVTSAGPTPAGKVSLKDGAQTLGTVTMSDGVATLTTSKLAVGTHPITAEYLGNADSATSTSSVLDQVVQ